MKTHFISIGGSVMHQLAIALKHKGYTVTGTDDEIFEPAKSNLEKEGLLPGKIGWDISKITPDIDAIILGMHAKEDNPELLKAKELGLKIYSFPEYIYQESLTKKRVVVGGSHGKTSTTSMIMHVLKMANKNFDYLVGAKLEGFAQSVNITNAPVIVCEGDEYPASAIEKRPKFHFMFPHIAILTGIAWDHINVFPTFDFYLDQFKIFIEKIEAGGILIYNELDSVLKKLVEENIRDDIRYQPYSIPSNTITDGKTSINITGSTVEIKVFGDHNLQNLYAAYFVCKELEISADVFVKAISSFAGAAKRLEILTSGNETIVYRDFAHAPSKVKASISAVKQQYPLRKLIAVLELHTYSSLNEQFMTEYKGAMDKSDTSVIFYSTHALELKRMPPLPKEKIMEGFDKEGLVILNDKEDLWNWLQQQNFSQSNLLLMSSGNYDGLDIPTFVNNLMSKNHVKD